MAFPGYGPYDSMISKTVDRSPCPDCKRRSDWDFLKDFYLRQENATREIQSLQGHIVQMNNALRHAGLTSQKDRMALNNTYQRMQELEAGFDESEVSRAALQDELIHEQREARKCRENLEQEIFRHSETERTLSSIWTAHSRLAEIVSKVEGHTDEQGRAWKSYNVTELVHEVNIKTHRLHELSAQLEQAKPSHDVELVDFHRRLHSEKDHIPRPRQRVELERRDESINAAMPGPKTEAHTEGVELTQNLMLQEEEQGRQVRLLPAIKEEV